MVMSCNSTPKAIQFCYFALTLLAFRKDSGIKIAWHYQLEKVQRGLVSKLIPEFSANMTPSNTARRKQNAYLPEHTECLLCE